MARHSPTKARRISALLGRASAVIGLDIPGEREVDPVLAGLNLAKLWRCARVPAQRRNLRAKTGFAAKARMAQSDALDPRREARGGSFGVAADRDDSRRAQEGDERAQDRFARGAFGGVVGAVGERRARLVRVQRE